jgi:hypothetical protein
LGHFSPAELREVVVDQRVRPERPDHNESPQLTDEVWQLNEDCWVPNPRGRPVVDAICDRIRSILDNRKISRPASQSPTPTIRATSPDLQHIYSGENGVYLQVPSNDLVDSLMPSSLATNSEIVPVDSLRYPPNLSDKCAAFSNSSTSARQVDIEPTITLPSELTSDDQILVDDSAESVLSDTPHTTNDSGVSARVVNDINITVVPASDQNQNHHAPSFLLSTLESLVTDSQRLSPHGTQYLHKYLDHCSSSQHLVNLIGFFQNLFGRRAIATEDIIIVYVSSKRSYIDSYFIYEL